MAIVNSMVATGRPMNGADGFTLFAQSWRRGRLLLSSGPFFRSRDRTVDRPVTQNRGVAQLPTVSISYRGAACPERIKPSRPGVRGKVCNRRIAAIIEDEVPCRGR